MRERKSGTMTWISQGIALTSLPGAVRALGTLMMWETWRATFSTTARRRLS